jgi:hypothetical protein
MIVSPVTYDPARDERNITAPAMSSGSPTRPSGIARIKGPATASLSSVDCEEALRMKPGATQFTRIRYTAMPSARQRARCETPALDTA